MIAPGSPRRLAVSRRIAAPAPAAAAVLFGACALIFVSPTLIGGKVLSPGTANPVLSDVVDVLHPWLRFARELIRSGELPAWNPYTLSGSAFFGNAQAGVLAPFNVPVWVLPFKYGLAVGTALKLWVAAMGAFLLARALRLGVWAGLVAGFSYGFLPFGILWLQFPHWGVWAWAPWTLWAAERILSGGSARDAAWLALAAAAAFLGGQPEALAHVAAVVGLYAAIRAVIADGAPRERLRRFGLVALGGVAGGLLAAVALVPIELNLHDASWVQGRLNQGQSHLPLASAHTLLFPDWWGRPTGLQLPGAPTNYNEGTLYPGAAALVLGAIGVATTAWRRTLPWILLWLVGLSAALGLPPVHQLLAALPPFDRLLNTRLIFLLGLATAILAAYGAECLVAQERPPRRALAVAAGAVAVGLIALIALKPSLHDLRLLGNHFRTGADWPQAIRLTAVAWFTIPVAIVLAATLLRRRAGPAVTAVVLLGAVGLDLIHFAYHYNPFIQDSPSPAAVHFGPDRVLYEGLQPDRQMTLRVRDARGYDPPLPRMRYWRLWRQGVPHQNLDAPLTVGSTGPAAQRLLRLLSVHTYVSATGAVARDPAAQPRAFVPATVRRVAGEPQAMAALFAAGFVPGRDAVVEGAAPAAARGRVDIARDDDARVDLRARLDRGGLVVLTDQLDRGWSVTVDGHSAPAVRVDSVMRGVTVPAGSHLVSWRYRVPGLRAGLALSALGLLLTIGLLVRRRRA